ncbi:GNAT family N-acetyltransferase [Paenibacillus humicola]|uniref:GNAT family N-acetyltransferase n=1 Tax=Paenibacillus humicola TaxID=3110540 RepID=UPI00237BB032|nr:GNAT family N-acetyltransferase [Paenibacillus humicola]
MDQAYRNQGIAHSILNELEARAKRLKFRQIRLEAGEVQPEALRFYRKHGFYGIEKYGEYVDSESSVCLEKRLGGQKEEETGL